jgi:hypothetical protein
VLDRVVVLALEQASIFRVFDSHTMDAFTARKVVVDFKAFCAFFRFAIVDWVLILAWKWLQLGE